MSDRDSAVLLMVQATLILHPSRGKAQVTVKEWLILCDELLGRSQAALGKIGVDLARRREKIRELSDDHACV